MIATDSSSLVVYLAGGRGEDIDLLDEAIAAAQLVLPPMVLTEVMSAPGRGEEAGALLAGLPLLELTSGYWERAGRLRGRVLAAGLTARLGDALIAQCCLDHDVPLIMRDRGFARFARHGLRLLPGPRR
jgi:predicted nucleic acid-binding protein